MCKTICVCFLYVLPHKLTNHLLKTLRVGNLNRGDKLEDMSFCVFNEETLFYLYGYELIVSIVTPKVIIKKQENLLTCPTVKQK